MLGRKDAMNTQQFVKEQFDILREEFPHYAYIIDREYTALSNSNCSDKLWRQTYGSVYGICYPDPIKQKKAEELMKKLKILYKKLNKK